jgi:hypothetical protein
MASLPNELWWNILAHAISFEGDLAMVGPSSERLHPFFPGAFPGFSDTRFHSMQLATWKSNNMIALNFMRVNRLWRGIAERFLYSAHYVEEEWRLQKFIDTVRGNPKLAEQLRTLVFMPRSRMKGPNTPSFEGLVVQVLGLCHAITAMVMASNALSTPLPLFQSPDFPSRLLLLCATRLRNAEFPTFMINFNNYASLQILELSVNAIDDDMLSSCPEHVTFPCLHTLVIEYLDSVALDVVGRWELPSLKQLSISRWIPLVSTALIPLIQRSYHSLEFLSLCMDILHDRTFDSITRVPPSRLTRLTLNIASSAHSSPPMRPAAKLVFCHVVTLGISKIGMIRPEDKAPWIRFLSDPVYMPKLRSVLTDATVGLLELCYDNGLPLLDVLRSLAKALEDRGVTFKGVTNNDSTFISISLVLGNTFVVSTFCIW